MFDPSSRLRLRPRFALFRAPLAMGLFLATCLACAPRDVNSAPATLKLATYNVENLFDGIPDNPRNKKERAKPKKELRALADIFHLEQPDVVAMQEVESQKTLKDFRDKYLKDMNYQEPIVIEGNDPRGIDVAVMSKWPIVAVKSHKDFKFELKGRKRGFGRDLLQVTLKAPSGYTLTVFAVHLKSKLGDKKESDAVREAEATAIQGLLKTYQSQNPKANFVVMGDFNDEPTSAPLKPLLGPQNPLGLVDIAAQDLGIKPSVFTYHPKKYRSRIDYILVSPSMMPEYRPRSVHIQQNPEAYWASDHLPLVAEFDAQDK
ncbi:MAG: endonuclease/exonuclease/phosphatase family protein [Candidatus Sericytochromatia bacterium]|nr:endonuclease/exonuclease/phosphatase family protein [Candidatus Sericytochromatia bacterium]